MVPLEARRLGLPPLPGAVAEAVRSSEHAALEAASRAGAVLAAGI